MVGARPQFVKTAPLSKEIRKRHHEVLVHTGQHYDASMSQVFFEELGIAEPDYNLGVGSGPHGKQTGAMLTALEPVLEQERPDLTLVYGDTNSTLAGALAAAKLEIPVAHVEAGVRSYDRAMPEEINRVLTDHIAQHLFCPTPGAVTNLAKEGVTRGVHHVGDVMFDALLQFKEQALARPWPAAAQAVQPGRYTLLTLHRAENVDDPSRLRAILEALNRLDETILFPVHPRTRARIEALAPPVRLGAHIHTIEPVGYLEMVGLEAQAAPVLTDSGGVQREAYFLQVPCLVLRSTTEWPELVACGASRLCSPDFREIHERPASAPSEPDPALFGGGDACRRIVRLLEELSGVSYT